MPIYDTWGTDWLGETLLVDDITPGDTNYSIEDSATALLAADPAIFESAAAVAIAGGDAGTLLVAEQLALTALTTTTNWSYGIEDSTAALLAADMDVLYAASAVNIAGGDAGTLRVDDLITLMSVITNSAWTYSLADSAANLMQLALDDDVASQIAVSLSPGAAAAFDLNIIDSYLLQVVDASAITELTGTAAQIAMALAADGLDINPEAAVTVDQGEVVASDLNAIGIFTAAVVNASAITEITGAAADIAAVIELARIDTEPDVAVTIDAGPAEAGKLNSIDSNTTQLVNATLVNLLSGTAEEIAAAISAEGLDTAIDITVTVNAGIVTASDLNTIDDNTSAIVDARAVGTITGTAEEIATAVSSDGMVIASEVAAILNAESAAAADLNTIDRHCTTLVDAHLVTQITGSAAEILGLVGSAGITMAPDYAVIVTGLINDAELAGIDAVNGNGTVGLVANVLESTYLVATPTTPAWIIANGILGNVIDCAGTQTIHVAAGAKLNLSGSDGHNVIVFDDYTLTDLSIAHSGATVIFSLAADSAQFAWIATDSNYAPEQTIVFGDGSQAELTLAGNRLQLGDLAITAVTDPFL